MRYHANTLRLTVVMAVATLVSTASAAPLLDGTKDAEYGAALSVQNTNTAFGNGTNGDPINGGGGSEIDGIYARVSGGRLYVLVAGNLETNFNKLDIFIDSTAGGVNKIIKTEQPAFVDPYCCGGFPPPNGGNPNTDGALQRMDGLTFDTGFNADYYLTVTHGFEGNMGGISAYAASTHYAKLSDPANSVVGFGQALGIQLAQRGLPNVLRGSTADVNISGSVDGNDFLVWQRNLGATGVNRLSGDASGNGSVGAEDLEQIRAAYGFDHTTAPLNANYFAPQSQGIDNSNVLLGPTLPGLTQGQLIDKAYVAAHPELNAAELQFVLPVVTPGNPENHRDMLNTVDLRLAIDNSNIVGVTGEAGSPAYVNPTTGNPADVTTGVEFSIPLPQIGSPTGAIKLFMFINGGSHDYSANQFSGTGILDSNLGGDGFGGYNGSLSGVNMNDYTGDQFVTIPNPAVAAANAVPEPAAASLLALALLGLAAKSSKLGRRRR